MISKIVPGAVKELEDYNSHHNQMPEGSVEITEREFWSLFMQYVWEYQDFKQVKDASGVYANTRLWIMRHWLMTVGVAVQPAHVQTMPTRFFKFGEWEKYGVRFANQFRGDNS